MKICQKWKKEIEEKLGVTLIYAAGALPPGTNKLDGGAIKNVLQSAGFELTNLLDEPTAANEVLKIKNGAVVDIGGGTTGIAILKDGEVIYVDSDYVMIMYSDGEFDLINVGLRKIYVENLDMMEVYVTEGCKVKAGDIIAESNFCKNGEINFGRNLLTAIMPKDGYNYEDGIIISDRLVKENIFTSVHVKELSFVIPESKILLSLDENKYKPLPKPYQSQDEKKPKKKRQSR